MKLVALVLLLASAVAFVKWFLDTPIGERLAAGTAAFIVAYDLAERTTRRGAALLRATGSWALLLQFALCFLATLAIAVIGFVVGTHSVIGLVIVVSLVLVALARDRVEGSVCERLATLGVARLEPHLGKGFLAWLETKSTPRRRGSTRKARPSEK